MKRRLYALAVSACVASCQLRNRVRDEAVHSSVPECESSRPSHYWRHPTLKSRRAQSGRGEYDE